MSCKVQINTNDFIISLPYIKDIHQELKSIDGCLYDHSLGYIIPIKNFEQIKDLLLDKGICIKEVEKIEPKKLDRFYFINPLNDDEFEIEYRYDPKVNLVILFIKFIVI
jgi:hypothetical protein